MLAFLLLCLKIWLVICEAFSLVSFIDCFGQLGQALKEFEDCLDDPAGGGFRCRQVAEHGDRGWNAAYCLLKDRAWCASLRLFHRLAHLAVMSALLWAAWEL